MKKGRVYSIFIAPAAGEPMQAVQEVTAAPGSIGFTGDRYAKGIGTCCPSPNGPEPGRGATLIALEAIEIANAQREIPFLPSETRRNIVIEGISAQDLNELVDRVFMIEKIFVYGVKLCHPCDRPSKLCGKPGFKEAFQNRGGLRVEILSPGKVSVGDEVILSLDF